MMKIGVVAVQGAFREHQRMLNQLGVDTIEIKRSQHLENLNGIVLPGGESTSIGKLMREYGLIEPIREMVQQGTPIFGTCAGMIVMAKTISSGEEPHLAVMDVTVSRNSFGRQKDSFEADLDMDVIGSTPFPAVFIRAPHIESVGENVRVLSRYQGRIVAVQEKHCLAISFHPELTDDSRIHQYFLEKIVQPSLQTVR
ncbi:pyridoxal phosphate synthase yaaE subunit [Alicyclobacillus tolerans]|uniref:Pyridoxal 5'-phosphate synthase subunit PdxT n=2 Tax=Alicyclobacillus tolerans TaxID=90970 RepID=A0A1M6PTD7_9BACL|nr:pyridoxal phosphate synthase yaaE subunit [Alicyclobacillus montanus]